MVKPLEIWEKYYNDAQMRSGLFAWYDFGRDKNILEWNPESGAITDGLTRQENEVTCLTDSEEQIRNISDRLNCGTVKYITRTELYRANEKYDYIVAVNPFKESFGAEEILENILFWKTCLKEDGKLLVVANNILSLDKMIGIKNSVGKEIDQGTLQKQINEFFAFVRMYYIFPDYIFPQAIYTKDSKPGYELVERVVPYAKNIEFICREYRDYYGGAASSGQLSELANSYMLECSNQEFTSNINRVTITSERKDNATMTIIKSDKTVEKKSVFQKSSGALDNIMSNAKAMNERGIKTISGKRTDWSIEMPFVDAPLLSHYLKDIVADDKEKFISFLDELYGQILKSSDVVENKLNSYFEIEGAGPVLKKAYVEMTPLNCFYDGEMVFFDQEYTMENCPAKFVLFRALSHLYCFDPLFENCVPLHMLKIRYEIESAWADFERAERKFLEEIRGKFNLEFFEYLTLDNKYRYMDGLQRCNIKQTKEMFGDHFGKKIVLWGTGKYFETFMNWYGNLFSIAYAIDSNKALWNTRKLGVDIKSPETLVGENCRVIITCSNTKEIIKALEEMGVYDYKEFVI